MSHNLKPISKDTKLQVKMMLNAGKPQMEIAETLGISGAKVNDIKYNKRNSKSARNSDLELLEIDKLLQNPIINNPDISNNKDNQNNTELNISNNQSLKSVQPDNPEPLEPAIFTPEVLTNPHAEVKHITIQSKPQYISQEYINIIDRYKKSKEKIITNLENLILSAIEVKLLNKKELSSLEICQLTDKYLLLTGLKQSLNSEPEDKKALLALLQVNINK